MKFLITYEYDPNYRPGYFAKTRFEGNKMMSTCGSNFKDARTLLIEKLRNLLKARAVSIPEPEEIEIDV